MVINDFTVKGSSTSATNSRKMGYVRRTCTDRGLPFVHIGELTGAASPTPWARKAWAELLGNDTSQFRRTRETPWAAAALDTSFGSSAWQCCCADFSVMKKGSIMAVSSPRLVSMAIGQKVDLEELGGWRLHAEQTGLIDFFVDTDAEAMAAIRRFLSYMPSHHRELPPAAPVAEGSGEAQDKLLEIVPEKRTQVYNMKQVIEIIVDRGSFFEIKARFGRPAVVGLARLGGRSVGIVANNPAVGGGALSGEACRKIVDFTVLCDSFNVPIIRLMDTPGFVVGLDAERRGAPGHIMNFMNATCLTTTPQITVIVRKAYGRAYVAMGGGAHNDAMIAWPTAEVSFMDPVFATAIVHNKTAGDEGLRGCAGAHPEGPRNLGHGADFLGARRHQAAGDPRLSHSHARCPAPPAHRRDRRAADADLADELLIARPGRRIPHGQASITDAARLNKTLAMLVDEAGGRPPRDE